MRDKPPLESRRRLQKAVARRVRKPRKIRPRLPVMKRYTVDCSGCNRKYELDFTGPVKFCCFCRSDKIKTTKRTAPPPFFANAIQGLFLGAGFAIVDRILRQNDPDYPRQFIKKLEPPGA